MTQANTIDIPKSKPKKRRLERQCSAPLVTGDMYIYVVKSVLVTLIMYMHTYTLTCIYLCNLFACSCSCWYSCWCSYSCHVTSYFFACTFTSASS